MIEALTGSESKGSAGVAATVPLVAAIGWLVAQVGLMDLNLSTVLRDVGIVAVLIWHMWYHTTKTYPNMVERFSAESEKIRVAFEKEQAATRLTAAEETAEVRRIAAEETAELRKMLMDTMLSTRTAVHDVKDTAQQVISRIGVSEEARGQR